MLNSDVTQANKAGRDCPARLMGYATANLASTLFFSRASTSDSLNFKGTLRFMEGIGGYSLITGIMPRFTKTYKYSLLIPNRSAVSSLVRYFSSMTDNLPLFRHFLISILHA